MGIALSQNQMRVLGCLVEKQLTTPDYYPLTLSALVTACNQKSNRFPVLTLTNNHVLDAINELSEHNLAREKQIPHARVVKYEHKLSGTLTQQYDFSQKELAVLSVLFLRGPQTSGEIRSRTNRMYSFATLDDVDKTLLALAEDKKEPFVKSLPRQPGRREIRFTQLFGEQAFVEESVEPVNASEQVSRTSELDKMRADITELRNEVTELKQMVDELLK